MPPPAALESFTEHFLDAHFDAHPTYAAYLGLHDYDGRVPDLSQEGIETRIADLRDALNGLDAIDAGPLELID